MKSLFTVWNCVWIAAFLLLSAVFVALHLKMRREKQELRDELTTSFSEDVFSQSKDAVHLE